MKKSPVHLNALRAFEASARHQSFSAAAAELHVTPAAVGQLVRTLEDWVGTPLFHRSQAGRARLLPTPAAEQALPDVRAGLDRLTLGLERLKEQSGGTMLTMTVSPAFAAKWLLPRIDRFQTAHPDIDIRLETSLKPVDFLTQRIDIGVRYGAGQWPGLVALKLMDEEVYPVCSPALIGRLRTPAQLTGETLIHDLSMETHPNFPSWKAWLDKAGVVGVDAIRGLKINNAAAVLQAAIEGHGIALARSVMAHDDIATGRLIRLFPEMQFPSPLAYYLVHRQESSHLPRIAAFRQWICEEASANSALAATR
ncbi:transcriptional regulator GcvA [Xanthomonas nasturtii]|uniref:transcriptional regulator GcvA n=1 Tax=Xanthomonas nasturtii TaxID=1843581 RepID=UPI002B2288C4|nr:transcriptional regulator GcvA [Xanthomonas nasturtii]MEA9578093.1 transcriptional regulator GcvA [Xanthomonas nasturtii]